MASHLCPGIVAAALAASIGSVCVAQAKDRDLRVVVTKPVLACEDTVDSPGLRHRMLDALPRWLSSSAVEPPCGQLAKGDVLMLDGDQTEADTHVAVKLWRRNCTRGCAPYMDPVYAPPRQTVGAYLRPTSAPPN